MTPERMLELFAGREDAFALQQANGDYYPVEHELSVAETQKHLDGLITVGVYQLRRADSRCRWGCIDLDVENRDDLEALHRAAVSIGIPASALLREWSGRKGYHLWVFFSEWVEAAAVKKLLEVVVAASGVPTHISVELNGKTVRKQVIEVFPKQTDLSRVPTGYGNLVKLPFGVHRVTGREATPLDVDGPVIPLTEAELTDLLEPYVNVIPLQHAQAAPVTSNGVHPFYPCTPGLTEEPSPEGGRNRRLFLLVKRWHVAGLSEDEVFAKGHEWNRRYCTPVMSDAEVIKTCRSGMNYTGMECLDPEVIPHCSPACPIYAREHPGTDGRVHMKVITSEPPVYHLPLTVGIIKVSPEELGNWEQIRIACRAQLFSFLPRRKPTDWDRELEPLLRNVITESAPPEVSPDGVVLGLYDSWIGQALDDPGQVTKRSVWRDDENAKYVFLGPAFIRYVQSVERTIPRARVWSALQGIGAQQAKRQLPDTPKAVECWEVPYQ